MAINIAVVTVVTSDHAASLNILIAIAVTGPAA